LSLSFYAFFFILLISIGYTKFQSFKGVPIEDKLGSDFSISKESLEAHVDITYKLLEGAKVYLTNLIICKSMSRTVRAVFVSYILSMVTGCCNFISFLWLGTILAFSVPVAYEQNKKLVDTNLAIACEQYNKYKAMALESLSNVPVINSLLVDKSKKEN